MSKTAKELVNKLLCCNSCDALLDLICKNIHAQGDWIEVWKQLLVYCDRPLNQDWISRIEIWRTPIQKSIVMAIWYADEVRRDIVRNSLNISPVGLKQKIVAYNYFAEYLKLKQIEDITQQGSKEAGVNLDV